MTNKNGRVYPEKLLKKAIADYKMKVGYKGKSFLEQGYVHAPYVPMYVSPTQFTEKQQKMIEKTKKVPKAEDPVKSLMRKIGYDVGEPKYEEVEDKPWSAEIGELQAFTGVDVEAELMKTISEEIKKEIDKEILNEITKIGQKP